MCWVLEHFGVKGSEGIPLASQFFVPFILQVEHLLEVTHAMNLLPCRALTVYICERSFAKLERKHT